MSTKIHAATFDENCSVAPQLEANAHRRNLLAYAHFPKFQPTRPAHSYNHRGFGGINALGGWNHLPDPGDGFALRRHVPNFQRADAQSHKSTREMKTQWRLQFM